MRYVFRWAAVAALTALLACTSLMEAPPRNSPREPGNRGRSESVALTNTFVEQNGTEGEAIVGIAISGGGSRAANFAASVMAELDRIGVMRKVTAISSVSGGSVAASYLAIHGDEPDRNTAPEVFWARTKAVLSEDFRSRWLERWLRPDQLTQTLVSNRTRTDVMADIFDEKFLNGATFTDLAKKKPALFIDATFVNDLPGRLFDPACTNRGSLSPRVRWESMAFDDTFLAYCLGTSASSLRVSTAVTASAAFPGVFNTVTLKRHQQDAKAPSYVHLIDGGPSDNLGMDGLLGRLQPEAGMKATYADACLLIIIDAFASGDPDQRHLERDLRSPVDQLVDLNFVDAVDAMLARRRFDTLQRLGLTPPSLSDAYGGYMPKDDFPLPGNRYEILKAARRFTPAVSVRTAMGYPAQSEDLKCAVWHIALDNITSTMAGQAVENKQLVSVFHPENGLEKLIQTNEWFERPEVQHRLRVGELVSRIRTDFNLVGPKHCKAKQLSDALWEAGRLAVQEDWTSRRAVCGWFKARGWMVADACNALPEPTARLPFSIEFEPLPGPTSEGFDVTCIDTKAGS
ncbi:lipoprotein, putative [Janthinobacterium sp. CG23_2]|nr:lipoprotein, putative [Janthinobacterium sp. CG23_2]CUU31457.1 lipoprotein, putative [Janthinobacterium sp. CG23_2]